MQARYQPVHRILSHATRIVIQRSAGSLRRLLCVPVRDQRLTPENQVQYPTNQFKMQDIVSAKLIRALEHTPNIAYAYAIQSAGWGTVLEQALQAGQLPFPD